MSYLDGGDMEPSWPKKSAREDWALMIVPALVIGAAVGAGTHYLADEFQGTVLTPITALSGFSAAALGTLPFTNNANHTGYVLGAVGISITTFFGTASALQDHYADKALEQAAVHATTDGRTVEQRMLSSAPKALSLANRL